MDMVPRWADTVRMTRDDRTLDDIIARSEELANRFEQAEPQPGQERVAPSTRAKLDALRANRGRISSSGLHEMFAAAHAAGRHLAQVARALGGADVASATSRDGGQPALARGLVQLPESLVLVPVWLPEGPCLVVDLDLDDDALRAAQVLRDLEAAGLSRVTTIESPPRLDPPFGAVLWPDQVLLIAERDGEPVKFVFGELEEYALSEMWHEQLLESRALTVAVASLGLTRHGDDPLLALEEAARRGALLAARVAATFPEEWEENVSSHDEKHHR